MKKIKFTYIFIFLIVSYLIFDCYTGHLTGEKLLFNGERAIFHKQYAQANRYLDLANEEIVSSNQSIFFSKGLTIEKMQNLRTITYLKGKVNFSLKQYDQALDYLNESIQMDPYHNLSYLKRAETFIKLNKFNEALSDYNTLIEFNNKFPDSYYSRGLLYYNHIRDFEKALADFEKAVSLSDKMPFRPESLYFENALALTYAEIGEFEKAEGLLISILKKSTLFNSEFRKRLKQKLEVIKSKKPWSEVKSNE